MHLATQRSRGDKHFGWQVLGAYRAGGPIVASDCSGPVLHLACLEWASIVHPRAPAGACMLAFNPLFKLLGTSEGRQQRGPGRGLCLLHQPDSQRLSHIRLAVPNRRPRPLRQRAPPACPARPPGPLAAPQGCRCPTYRLPPWRACAAPSPSSWPPTSSSTQTSTRGDPWVSPGPARSQPASFADRQSCAAQLCSQGREAAALHSFTTSAWL